jgi:hypothetical protein
MFSLILKNAERLLLPLPFPVVIIWWIIVGSFIGSFIFGSTYAASWGIVPVAAVGMWRVLVKYFGAKKKAKK